MDGHELAQSMDGVATALATAEDGPWCPGFSPEIEALAGDEVAIRLAEGVGWGDCVDCGTAFRVAGPTGFLGAQPLCDTCVLERSEGLGTLLMLGMAVRSFAGFAPEGRPERLRALDELAAVARVYDRLTAVYGPPRSFLILGTVDSGEPRSGAHRGQTGTSEAEVEGEGKPGMDRGDRAERDDKADRDGRVDREERAD